MMKKLLLLISVVLAACSSSPQQSSVLKTAFSSDPSSIDPRKNRDFFSSFFQKLLFEGLTRMEEGGKIEMALAKSAEISSDGLMYRFHLRDAVWSDGRPITAGDFEYTWKKVLDKKTGAPCAFLFYPILHAAEAFKGEVPIDQVGIRALNDKTLEIVLSHPTPYFLSLISFCPFFAIPKHVDQAHPAWDLETEHLVCNGPYRLVTWERNNRILVEKNPKYWNRGQVSLNGVEILIIPDEKTALNMFEQGEIDLLNSLTTSFSPDELVHLKPETKPLGATSFCTFNLEHPFLKNRSIRNALSLAINRAAIVENITQMNEQPASRFLPSIVAPSQKQLMQSYNPSLAKTLFSQGLTELNQQQLPTLHLSHNTSELSGRVAQAVQQEWKEALGLEVELEELDDKSLMAQVSSRHYTIALETWALHYLDPVGILDRFKYKASSKNYPGFENSEYIALLDKAQHTNDAALRLNLLEQAETIIVHEMPLAPIFHFNQVLLKNNRFTNIHATPLGDVLFAKVKPGEP